PNVNEKTTFIGPPALSQVRLFTSHPTGEMNQEERLEALMTDDGLEGCGNSQNCVRSCPKGIPLTTSIAEMNKETTKHMFK
ncbi:succinate dehydrogenase iron-sulfur subunit, partial [Bacillus cereus]|nr:succinate dehydrogenase iron-sulfur subunit [Bacillus cereus]